MEIPRNHPASSAVTVRVQGQGSVLVVPISDLKLEPNQVYEGRIIGKAQAPASPQTAPPLPGGQTNNAQGPAGSIAPQQGLAPEQYLLQLQGKTVLISSVKALQAEQRLSLMLIEGATPGLKVVNNTTSTNDDAAPLPAGKLPAAQVQTLLQALTPIMAKQSSLAAALSQLQHWQNHATGPNTALVQQTLSATIKVLETFALDGKTLNASEILKPTTQSNAPSAAQQAAQSRQGATPSTPGTTATDISTATQQAIKTRLLQSGLFNEHILRDLASQSSAKASDAANSITSATANTTTNTASTASHSRESLLKTLGQLASQALNKATPQSPSHAPATMGTPAAGMPPATGTAINRATLSTQQAQAIRHLEQLIQQLAPSSNSTQPPIPTQGTEGIPGIEQSDLKGLLRRAIHLLTPPAEGDTPAQRPAALTQTDILKTPFDFPHPASTDIARASAALSEEPLSTGQLLRLLASMLNRIQFNQLNSLYQSHTASNETQTQQSWFFELPLLSHQQQLQALNLRIDKREESDSGSNTKQKRAIQWQVVLSFDLDQLGPLYIEAKLTPPRVATTVWAKQQTTLQLLQKEQQQLQQRLEALGLEVEEMQCRAGQPRNDATKLEHRLVDLKA